MTGLSVKAVASSNRRARIGAPPLAPLGNPATTVSACAGPSPCCSNSAVVPVSSMEAAVQPVAEVRSPAKHERLWMGAGPASLTAASLTGADQPPTAYHRSSSPPPTWATAPLMSYSIVAAPPLPPRVTVSPARVPSPLKPETR